MDDDFEIDSSDISFTDSVRGHCPNCGHFVEIPIVIHTDGHYADVNIVETDEEDDDLEDPE